MSSDPYRIRPPTPDDDAEVPAGVPVAILVLLLGVMLTVFAPRRDTEPSDAPSFGPHAWTHVHEAPRR